MDELKFLLDETDIEYTETEIIINNKGIKNRYNGSKIENIESIFVSLHKNLMFQAIYKKSHLWVITFYCAIIVSLTRFTL